MALLNRLNDNKRRPAILKSQRDDMDMSDRMSNLKGQVHGLYFAARRQHCYTSFSAIISGRMPLIVVIVLQSPIEYYHERVLENTGMHQKNHAH